MRLLEQRSFAPFPLDPGRSSAPCAGFSAPRRAPPPSPPLPENSQRLLKRWFKE